MSPRSPTGRSADSRMTYAGLIVAAVAAAILLESLLVLLMVLVVGLLVLRLVTPWLAGPVVTTTKPAPPVGPHRDRVDFLELLPLHLGPLMRTLYHWQLGTAPSTWGWLLGRLQETARGRMGRLPYRHERPPPSG